MQTEDINDPRYLYTVAHRIPWELLNNFKGTTSEPFKQNKVSVSVYYVAVRTIVLSCHGSNLARPVIIHDIIHGLIYVPSTQCCGFFGVSPDGNCAYVH